MYRQRTQAEHRHLVRALAEVPGKEAQLCAGGVVQDYAHAGVLEHLRATRHV